MRMSVPDQEKLGVKLHARPSRDTISAIPIKKRRYIFSRSPSPPPETQSSPTVDCDTTQNKSFCLVKAPSLEAGDIPTCLTASSDKVSSLESRFKILANGDTSEAPKHEDLIEHNCNNRLQSLASIVAEGENGLKDTVSDDKLVSLIGIERHSAPVGYVDVPMEEEISDAKNIVSETYAAQRLSGNCELQYIEIFEKAPISESRSVRQEQLELQDPSSRMKETLDVHDPQKKCFISGPNTDSIQICLDRSNWDLNTTMDTWEESLCDSAVIHEGNGHCRPDFGGVHGRGPQRNFMGASATSKKPNAFLPMFDELKSLSRDHFLSPCTSPKSGGVLYYSETEACLDLRLNPSFMSESCLTHGNVDSLKKMQFLSLSTMHTSTADPKFSICGAVKSDPYHGCIQLEKRTKFTGSETFSLSPIKSEPCEIGEASRITVSGVTNSPSDAAIKLETVEDKSQDCVAAKETRLSYVSAYDHKLLQNTKTPLETVGTRVIASNTQSDSFIKEVIMQTPREYPHLRKYEEDTMAQVMQDDVLSNDKICHRAMSAAASIRQPEKGIFCEPIGLVMESLAVEDKSQDCVAAKETRLSHVSAYDNNLLQSAKTPLEAVGTRVIASNTQSDSFIKDVIMQTPREYPHIRKYEEDNMTQVMQDEVLSNDKISHRAMSAAASIPQPEKGIFCEPIGLVMESLAVEDRELISIKQASHEGSEHPGFFIKCPVEQGQIKNLVGEACEQRRIAAESLQESFSSGTLVETVADEKAEVVSRTSLSETDSKIGPVVETCVNCDVLEFNQAKNESICMLEEQGDNECKTGSSHVLDGGIHAVKEKGRIDDHGYEDCEVKDGALLSANEGCHLRIEREKAEDTCPIGLVDIPMAMSSSDELVKHSIIESSEMSKDPGTVECVNNIDPTADQQESSSVTGDSSRRKTSKTTRMTSRDSLKKDKVSERKTKSDRDPTLRLVNIENKSEGSGVMETAGGRAKSFVPLSASETKRDAFDRGRIGRIINLNSGLSQKMKPIHERPLSSRVEREKPTYKSFKMEKSRSRHSRYENPNDKSCKTENEKRRGLACGKGESDSIHMRVRGGSDSLHLRVRDERRPKQFGDRNFDPNYMHGQINDHNDFRYSRSITSAEVPIASGSDASVPCAGRISRKVTNELQSHTHMPSRRHSPGGPEMHHPSSEVNPSRCMNRDAADLVFASQGKMNRPVPGEMMDPPLRVHSHSQFERSDRIPAHRDRRSLSPVHRRGPSQLSPPMCSPRSHAMSPSHWSQHNTSEGFNGQPEMVQCRTATPIVMQESMRSTRQRFAEEILSRRRGSAYGDRLLDGMEEVVSSRGHDFPRPRRDFPRKIRRLDMNDSRQVPGEYYRTPFIHGQVHEHAVDSEFTVGRRCNEVHVPASYRQHCIEGNDDENFSLHDEGPPRPYRYHAEGNQGFNEGESSREFEGRFRKRLGNTSRRYRHIEQQQHDDGFMHQEEQGWNDSGFNNIRPKRRY